MMISDKFGRAVLAAAVAFAVLPAMAADSLTGGPMIPNPQIEEGALPKDAKGFSKAGSNFTKGRQSKPQTMGQVTVSDRCFVTSVDYCYMDGYAPLGEPCICSDGYYYYDGVVY